MKTVFIRYAVYPPTKAIHSAGCVLTHLLNPSFEKMASSLGVNELGKLLSEYSKYQVKWYDTGLQLGIDKYVLDTVRGDCQNNIGSCFCKMLVHWLENDLSATELCLQKAIEVSVENNTQQRSLWYKAILILIIGMMVYMIFYYHSPVTHVTLAAETLRKQYREHHVMKFNLLNISNSEYLGAVMKDTMDMSLDIVSWYKPTQVKVVVSSSLNCPVQEKQPY